MYVTPIAILSLVLVGLLLKFFFPHKVNQFLAGETYETGSHAPGLSNPEEVLEALPTSLFVVNEEYKVTYANSSFSRELGLNVEELRNRSIDEIFDVSEGLKKSFSKIQSEEFDTSTNRAQVTYRDRSGNKTRYEILFTPLNRGNTHEYVCMIPTLHDLHASRNQQRKSERLKALGEMISGLAHEINNPLTGVVGFANLILESDDNPTHEEELRIIQENAQRCRDVIENMLGFIRSEDSEPTEQDINEILQNAIKLTRRDFDINNIEIEQNLDPELPTITARRTQLEEVFINLLSNAKDALGESPSDDLRIRVKTQPLEDDGVLVTVLDNGPGIPEEDRDEIFEPFYTQKQSGEGTGLGLTIVQGIIDGLDGSISAGESSFWGAKFEIRLPTGPDERELEAKSNDQVFRERLPDDIDEILAIEDEESIRRLFDTFREKFNLDGKNFENPIKAIEYLNHFYPDRDPDVIFLDLVFPGKLRGQDFVDWIESNRPELLNKVILMTGNPQDNQVGLTDTYDSIFLVKKPLNISDLIEVINRQRSVNLTED